jgi:hypothetical protein
MIQKKGGVFFTPNIKGKIAKTKKLDLIVIRVDKTGKICNSRPCFNCLDMMKAVNIRRVHYTTDDGVIITEQVKDMISIQASSVTRHIHELNSKDKNNYFEILLKTLFPSYIKKYNFDNFIKHNLNNVLPSYYYEISKLKGNEIVMILSPDSRVVVSSIIL